MTTLITKYDQGSIGALNRPINLKLQEFFSVKDFGAVGDGVADDTTAIQAAITAGYSTGSGFSIYFPKGTYLMSSTITMGNTSSTVGIPTRLFGDYRASIIKVSAANVNPFLWQGPNPDVDGAGNRTGSVVVENLNFQGPGSSGTNTNSIALSFYGVQGITLRNTYSSGWYAAESYHNVDLVNRFNVWIQQNYNGVISNASGYALNSSLNSFNSYGGQVGNHNNYGIHYLGGLNPCFYGVNFTINKTSIALSPGVLADGTTFTTNMVTVSPTISGCYFEGDTGTSIQLGGGTGIVRGGSYNGNNFIAAYAGPLITVSNYSNSLGIGSARNNTFDTSFSGSSFISQTSSFEKLDYNNLNGTMIGDVTPSSGVFTQVNSGFKTYSAIAGGTVDILSIGTYSNIFSGTLTIVSTSPGKSTVHKYSVSMMGSGNIGGFALLSSENYSGGSSPFTLLETANSPSAGYNKLSITNNDTVTSTYYVIYTSEYGLPSYL